MMNRNPRAPLRLRQSIQMRVLREFQGVFIERRYALLHFALRLNYCFKT